MISKNLKRTITFTKLCRHQSTDTQETLNMIKERNGPRQPYGNQRPPPETGEQYEVYSTSQTKRVDSGVSAFEQSMTQVSLEG